MLKLSFSDIQTGKCSVKMASAEGLQRFSPHKSQLYDFCIKFLKISGIHLPVLPKSGISTGNSAKNTRRYFLKITLLQGTEQQKIGDFEVIGDECIINHQLSCQIAYGRPEKLHVYIDQDWSAGLSGHIAVDLKEFFEDVDAEIYLEYPLFSSGASNVTVRRTAELAMSVLCTCSKTTTALSNRYDPNIEYMGFEDISKLRPTPDELWVSPVPLDTESSHAAQSMQLDSALKQVSPEYMCLVNADREVEILKEMEGDFIELTSKLNNYLAAQSLEKYASGEHRRSLPSRPEVLAAMFFAAGMAFQRQVDCANRLRMYRGAEDPLLPGENRSLLLEDVSPNFRGEASTNTEFREVGTFCQGSSRRSLEFSEGSSHSCGLTESCSGSSDGKCAEATTSLAGDMDEDKNYFHSPLRAEDLPMAHPDPEPVSPRTSKSSCSPFGEMSSSMETMSLVKNESVSRKRSSIGKYNVLNVVDSVLHAFAIVGLPGWGSKETRSRVSGEDDQVIVSGSMLGRQQVTSIQTIRKSNPGLGWLSNSMQSE